MQNKLYPFLLLAVIMGFAACRKDQMTTDIIITNPGPIQTSEVDILGFVTDLDGNALEGATVSLGTAQEISDANGIFRLHGLAGAQATLKVEKDGFFTTYPTLLPSTKATNQIQVRLLERSLTTTLSAVDGGTATLSNGAGVEFSANGFIDQNGSKYEGQVHVYAAYLDPTHPLLDEFMPGNLTAINNEDQLQVLQSFGMINVELEDAAGQALQIDLPATLDLPLPASLQDDAPNEIPLWYFDETAGLWVEEGTALRNGDRYIGIVNHFSFWNCDVPYDLVLVSGQLDPVSGTLNSSLKVCIKQLPDGQKKCAYTDFKGFFSGLVPSDALLLLEVYDNCDELIYSEQIGPFSVDTDLGLVPITLADNWALVSGQITDCDQNPITEGYAYVDFNGITFNKALPVDANGAFSGLVNYCNATEAAISGVNTASLEYGNPLTFSTGTTIDAGTLSACGNQLQASVLIEYGGSVHQIQNCEVTVEYQGSIPYIYTFTAADAANDVAYQFSMIDWNLNPDEPLYGYAITIIQGNNPGPDIFSIVDGMITLVSANYNPSGIIEVKIEDCTVENMISGAVYPNSTLTLTGLVQ